jgi:hypothetical protein
MRTRLDLEEAKQDYYAKITGVFALFGDDPNTTKDITPSLSTNPYRLPLRPNVCERIDCFPILDLPAKAHTPITKNNISTTALNNSFII